MFSVRSGRSAFTSGSLCGMKEAVCVRYLAQDVANSDSSVNGGYNCHVTDSAHFCWGLCTSSGEQRCSCSPVSLAVYSQHHQPSALEIHKEAQLQLERWVTGCRGLSTRAGAVSLSIGREKVLLSEVAASLSLGLCSFPP